MPQQSGQPFPGSQTSGSAGTSAANRTQAVSRKQTGQAAKKKGGKGKWIALLTVLALAGIIYALVQIDHKMDAEAKPPAALYNY